MRVPDQSLAVELQQSTSVEALVELKQMKEAGDDLAKQLKPAAKKNGTENPDYMDTMFILGTSLVVERFFSLCRNILIDERASLTPKMFGCLAFLKVNKELWELENTSREIRMWRNNELNTEEVAGYVANQEIVDEAQE